MWEEGGLIISCIGDRNIFYEINNLCKVDTVGKTCLFRKFTQVNNIDFKIEKSLI
jgi:hypothetical protein